jgi:hypothetical protein
VRLVWLARRLTASLQIPEKDRTQVVVLTKILADRYIHSDMHWHCALWALSHAH